jgi:hypothetical protein
MDTGDKSREWMATYVSQEKTAKFRIVLRAPEPADSKVASLTFGKGSILAEPGSDASVMLADLQKALEAKKLPSKVRRLAKLEFTYAGLGENLSRSPDGGFYEKPPGNWRATKIFVGDGEDEGEVFLNLNSKIGKGEFSIKDPDFGDVVLAQLAKVI